MLTIAASQGYTGPTTVSAGTLQLSPGSIGISSPPAPAALIPLRAEQA